MVRHIVIIGGGLAGINTVKKLRHLSCHITLIDRMNHHLFQPLLYQVATAKLTASQISTPLRECFSHYPNVHTLMGEVVDVNKEEQTILLKDGEKIGYDDLVIAVGATHSYFGNNHFEPFAPGLKTIEDALHIRERLLIAFEKAEREKNEQKKAILLRFVIVGAGPTGVELAGTIAELKTMTFKENFRNIDPRDAEVILIEGFDDPLPPYPKALRKRARKDLEQLGVKLLTKTKVLNITSKGVETDQGFIEACFVIWAAGNEANPLIATLGTPTDRQGRAIVNPDLTLPLHSNIYVIGDCAHFTLPSGLPIPGVGAAAIQQGKFVAKVLKDKIQKKSIHRKFVYFDKGNMATIGSFRAVLQSGQLQMTGFLAWIAWLFVHIGYLISFRNRMSVLFDWTIHYLCRRKRSHRIIHSPYKAKKSIDDI